MSPAARVKRIASIRTIALTQLALIWAPLLLVADMEPAGSDEVDLRAPVRHRDHQPHPIRIYRIRAAGANGNFGAGVTVTRARQRPGPADEPDEPDEAHAAEARQPRLLADGGTRWGAQKASACPGADEQADASEAGAAASVSASSQTLQLSSRPSSALLLIQRQPGRTGTPPAPARGQRRRPAGELDESLAGRPLASSSGEQLGAKTALVEPRPEGGGGAPDRHAGIMNLIDDFDSKITTNRTQAQLSCDSGEIIVRLNFSEPFKGIVYPDHNRLSPCRFFGDGHHNYELRLPLRGCGTKQVAPRVFVNDVIVRFHKTLELEEDEVKTLICRYPPPLDGSGGVGAALASQGEREREAAGTGLVHELPPALNNRTQAPADAFELLEFSGAPRPGELDRLARPGGGAGEASLTLEELARRHRQQQQQQQQQHADLILANSHPFRQANGSANSRLAAGATTNAGSLLERLSSIELLFLISSLMFLALLSLGLLASYYCFWRHDSAGPASARRRRKLRYFRPAHLGGSSAAQLAAGPNYSAARRYLAPGVAPAAPGSSFYQQSAFYPQAYASQRVEGQQQLQAPSSPDDSDVSGQVLLPAASGHTAGRRELGLGPQSRRHEPQQQQQHYANSALRSHYDAHHYGAPAPPAPTATVLGRRAAEAPASSHTLGRRRQLDANLAAARGYASPLLATGHKWNTLGKEPLLTLATPERDQWDKRQARRPAPADRNELLAWQKHQQQLVKFAGADQASQRQRAYATPATWRPGGLEESRTATSDSEPELEPGPAAKAQETSEGDEAAKLVLKSIEDSFVTKFTEISEQRYDKYDTRRPLHWAQWLERQPGRRVEHEAAQPTGAGLRSLTELDVNFAKTLPRPASKEPAAAGEGAPAAGPPAAPTPSPDLIISADYDFGRFKLVGGDEEEAPTPTPAPAPAGLQLSRSQSAAKSPGGQSRDSFSYV